MFKSSADDHAATWRPVPGLPFEVSGAGEVRRVNWRRPLRREARAVGRGRAFVRTTINGRRCKVSVARLVALAWLGPPPWDDAVAVVVPVLGGRGASAPINPRTVRWVTPSAAPGVTRQRGSKLTAEVARQILSLRPPGRIEFGVAAAVAAAFAVSSDTVQAIWHRRRWRSCGTPTRWDAEAARVAMGVDSHESD